MLDFALSSVDEYTPSAVAENTVLTTMRQSLTISDSRPAAKILKQALKPVVQELAAELGVTIPDKPIYDGSLTAHTDGAFYKPHIDLGGPGIHRTRALSAVYYFFNTPKRFEGGDLRLYSIGKPGEFVDIPALDNQLVVFPSMVLHEVRPVTVPSGKFEDARFAFNIWVHRLPKEQEA